MDIMLFMTDCPIRRALLKASFGILELSPSMQRLCPLDGNRETLGFFQAVTTLYLEGADPDSDKPCLLSLLDLGKVGLDRFQTGVVRAIATRMHERNPAVPLLMLSISNQNEPHPNLRPLPWELSELIEAEKYPLSNAGSGFDAALDTEIERLIQSPNHSPLGQFSLFAGAPLPANALKLYVLCLLASPEPKRDAYRNIFEAWYSNQDGTEADVVLFEQWRREHRTLS